MKSRQIKKALTRSLVALIVALPIQSHATITVQDEYKLGDADAGATAGGSADSTTVDSAGSQNLTLGGSATYSSTVPASNLAGSSDKLSLSVPSSLSFYSGDITFPSTNFGFEIYVDPSGVTATTGFLDVGKPYTNGLAIFQEGNHFDAQIGGGTAFGTTAFTSGSWYDLAVVVSGTTSTFYVNGVAAGTSTTPVNTGGIVFYLGNYPAAGSQNFSGLLDNARYFTFSAGSFSTSDLLDAPEPSTWWMVLGGLLVLSIRPFLARHRSLK